MAKRTLCICLFSAALGAQAIAQVTALGAMPSADRRGVGEWEFGYGVAGTEPRISRGYGHSAYVLVGLHERFELGTATDFLGAQTWGFKLGVAEAEDGRWALSAGMQGLRSGEMPGKFLVGRFDTEPVRWHFGYLHDGVHRGMLGVDGPLNDEWSWSVDHISGGDGMTTGALFYAPAYAPGWTLTLAGGAPNRRDDGFVHSATLSYALRF